MFSFEVVVTERSKMAVVCKGSRFCLNSKINIIRLTKESQELNWYSTISSQTWTQSNAMAHAQPCLEPHITYALTMMTKQPFVVS